MPAIDPQRFLTSFLRRELSRHNRRALGYFLFTFASAAVLWWALYGLSYWLVLLGLSAVKGADAAVPIAFPTAFLAIACALLVGAWFHRLATTSELPRNETSVGEIAMDFLLMIPRITFAAWGNLSAFRKLSPAELEHAAELLALVLQERRVPMHRIPVCITDDRQRDRIVYALLLLQILHLHWEGETPWLRISPLAPARLQLGSGGSIV